MITTDSPNYFYNDTSIRSRKYALLTANEIVMLLPEYKTVLADLQDKWQAAHSFKKHIIQLY